MGNDLAIALSSTLGTYFKYFSFENADPLYNDHNIGFGGPVSVPLIQGSHAGLTKSYQLLYLFFRL